MHKPQNTNSSLAVVEPGMRRINLIVLLCLTSCLAFANAIQSDPVLRYVSVVPKTPELFIVDTRAQQRCEHNSLAGAHCLPASDLIGPHGELPGFADIYWLLGTLGITGSEHVLVIGHDRMARDYVAGILYLCGQARISVLNANIDELLASRNYKTASGTPRAILRLRIFKAVMRDQALILPAELEAMRRHSEKVVMVDAKHHNITNRTLFKHVHVLFSRHVRKAIAAFAHMRALAVLPADKIKVVPVAYAGTGMPASGT